MGCGLPQGLQANNIGRIAVLLSKHLAQETSGVTVSRYCASSLESIRLAANNVVAGQGDVYIAGGRRVRLALQRAAGGRAPRGPERAPAGQATASPDAYIAMGMTAENVAAKYGVSREDQDAYAKRSQDRAVAASGGRALRPRDRPGPAARRLRRSSRDEGPRPGTTIEKLATLKPAFKEDGTVTAGNACPLNDGAAATLIMSADKAAELGLQAARADHHRRDVRQRARVHGRRADLGRRARCSSAPA